mmetsp:Transcript_55009/g.109164  ORF Transcript_55009/g.109164 Transcript_55009/m.109164 type:complete len:140 (+) Transcript_55009:655-1074(+)
MLAAALALLIGAKPGARDTIVLNGANPLMLYQGDLYLEQGLIMSDALKESIGMGTKAAPVVSFDYSTPVAFGNSIDQVGDFEVEYTVEAPWLSVPVKLTREVQVLDVDECTYTGIVESLKHTCDSTQTCTNTEGSFTCN